jgi:hypothetical protein
MKVLFVINSKELSIIEMVHTGHFPAIKRRSVEIKLTNEQVEQLEIKRLGSSNGKPVFEAIESISEIIEGKNDGRKRQD